KADKYNVRCVRDAASASRMPYRFDNEGRHIATIDLDTGKTLVQFAYDNSGKLYQITDQFGDIISIVRDSGGKTQRIVAPDGQVTELAIDDHYNPNALTYEDHSDFHFDYQAGGLMTENIDPHGNSYTIEFD